MLTQNVHENHVDVPLRCDRDEPPAQAPGDSVQLVAMTSQAISPAFTEIRSQSDEGSTASSEPEAPKDLLPLAVVGTFYGLDRPSRERNRRRQLELALENNEFSSGNGCETLRRVHLRYPRACRFQRSPRRRESVRQEPTPASLKRRGSPKSHLFSTQNHSKGDPKSLENPINPCKALRFEHFSHRIGFSKCLLSEMTNARPILRWDCRLTSFLAILAGVHAILGWFSSAPGQVGPPRRLRCNYDQGGGKPIVDEGGESAHRTLAGPSNGGARRPSQETSVARYIAYGSKRPYILHIGSKMVHASHM